jgi:hypothetical protein
MQFFPTIFTLVNRRLRPFQLVENVTPRTFQQIEVEVGLVRSLSLVSVQGFFEVAERNQPYEEFEKLFARTYEISLD